MNFSVKKIIKKALPKNCIIFFSLELFVKINFVEVSGVALLVIDTHVTLKMQKRFPFFEVKNDL